MHSSNKRANPVLDQKYETAITTSVYLSRREAAQYLNLPATWLANNARRGPRYIKIGGHVRYSVATLDAFMAAHEGRHQ